MDKIKVLIADDIDETRSVIKKILDMESAFFEVVGEANNGEEVLKAIPKLKPDVVLMDINMPVLNGLEATEKITDEFTNVIVIIMSVQGENEYLKKAMFHGAKEYIIKPFNYETLVTTIKTTYEKYRDKQVRITGSKERLNDAKVVTFFSSKGGVGKSVLALNSALIMSRDMDKKVLLIDMDLQFGDISMMVNKYNEKNILDAVDDGHIDSYENIKPYLYKHDENLDMLFAPVKPEAAEYIVKDTVIKIMKSLLKHYDVIIVDTGINFNDNTLYILDISKVILLVSTMEIISLKNTRLGLQVMQSLGYDNDKVKLIINKCTSSFGISRKNVEEAFKDNILAVIPEEEKTVTMSVNTGDPLCSSPKYLKLKIGKVLKQMCEELIG